MIIVHNILGNAADAEWQGRLAGAAIDVLALDQWEAQKSRLRKRTAGAVELALSLDRNHHLHDGDILVWNEAERRAIVARIALNDVMIVDLGALKGEALDVVVRTIFELGHALGNQHWPAIVKGDRVFVPLTIDRKVMMSVMKTHAFSHIAYEFVPGVEVIPYVTPHEARRLFGGAGAASHAHPPAGDGHGHHHHPDGHQH
jgi:urease accessory protein